MEKFYENMESYLNGELTGQSLAGFENDLKNDPELTKTLRQNREMQHRLEALRLRQKVTAALSRSATAGQPAKMVSIFSNPMVWAAAACFVALVATVWLFQKQPIAQKTVEIAENQPKTEAPSIEKPAPPPVAEPSKKQKPPENRPARQVALAKEYHENPPVGFIRGAVQNDLPAPPARLAAEAFENKDYAVAAGILKPEGLVSADENLRFLRAHARFQVGQFAAAASDFRVLENSFQFKHDARWNLLLCRLAIGQNTADLKMMAEDVDFPFQEKAAKLRAALSDRKVF